MQIIFGPGQFIILSIIFILYSRSGGFQNKLIESHGKKSAEKTVKRMLIGGIVTLVSSVIWLVATII